MAESGMLEVIARVTDGPEATVSYNFGANLDEMRTLFGDEVVFSTARAQMKIQLQARMRSWMTAEPPRDVVAMAAMWKPGVVADRTLDPLATAKTYLANLSDPEDKKRFLEELRAAL